MYEGEGNCEGKSRTTIQVNITQKEPWLCNRFKELFGGRVIQCHRGLVNEQYRWYITGGRGRGFLYTVYSFLSPRRRVQARKALKAELLKRPFDE